MERTQLALKTFISMGRAMDALVQAARHDVQQYGLNLNEFAVLQHLYHKGPQVMQAIKRRILIANSSTTYIIDKLCQKQLTERHVCPKDARVTYVHLTESGKQLMDDHFAGHAAMLREQFHRLSDEELQQLHELLKRFTGYTA
ncbi:MAG: MarR family transcriptional regulator [Aerococcaceae bacterium]|nr:MarR family transcriptional regulator [Aerococcaceae bacterium]